MATAHFCPGCGRGIEQGSDQAFCAACGRDLRALTDPASKVPEGAAQTKTLESAPTPSTTVSVPLVLPRLLQSGQPLRQGAEAAAVPVALWAVVSAIIASLVPVVGITVFSVIGSFLAGLGYHVAASATAGSPALGVGISATGEGTFAAAPFLSLLGIATAAWWGQRRVARRAPAATPSEAARRAVIVAAIAAASILVIAQLSAGALGDGTAVLNAASRLTGASVSELTQSLQSLWVAPGLTFGPNLLGVLPLFIFLFAGALAGEGLLVERTKRWVDPVGRRHSVVTAIGGYLAVAAAIVGIGVLLSVVVLFLYKVDFRIFLVWLGLLPNVVVVAIATLFGAGIDGIASSSISSAQDPTHLDVWRLIPTIALPLAALPAISAGFVAGAVQQRRQVPHSLTNSLVTAATVLGLSLALAMIALPSASATGATSLAIGSASGGDSGNGMLAVTLTLGPELLLGFLLIAGGAHVGRRFGGRSLQFVIIRGEAARRRIGDTAHARFALAMAYWRRRGAKGLAEDSRQRLVDMSRPAKIGLAALGVGILLLGFGLNFVNSVDFRLKGAIEDIAARHPSTVLGSSSSSLADDMGVGGAPADVTFHVSGIMVKEVPGGTTGPSYDAGWTLAVERNGTQIAQSAQHATFASLPDSDKFEIWTASGKIALADLLVGVKFDSVSAAQAYVEASAKGNADLGVDVSLMTATESVPSTETTIQDEATWLSSEPEETVAGVDGEKTVYNYSVQGSDSTPLFSAETLAPTPTVTSRGTLTEEALKQSADNALVALAAAKSKGDLPAAMAVLAGADGLQVSGLRTSTIPTELAAPLTVSGDPVGGYFVLMSDGRKISPASPKDYKGVWLVDYADQPLFLSRTATATFKYLDATSASFTFVAYENAGKGALSVETSWLTTSSFQGWLPLTLTPVADGQSLESITVGIQYPDSAQRDFQVDRVPGKITLQLSTSDGWSGPASVEISIDGTPGPTAAPGGETTRVAICTSRLRSEPSGDGEDKTLVDTIPPKATVTVVATVSGKAWQTGVCGSAKDLKGNDWYQITEVNGKSVADLYKRGPYVYSAAGQYK